MTQDEIIEMTRQKKFLFNNKSHVFWVRLFTAFAVSDVLFLLCLMRLDGVI